MFNSNRSTLKSTLLLIIALLSVQWSNVAVAGDKDDPHKKKHNKHHSNTHIALFVGTASTDGHSNLSLGSDLEYRLPVLSNIIGVGAVADAVISDHSHLLAAGGLFIHPVGGVKLVMAPGAGFEEGHSAFVMRTGVSYDMHFNALSISPTFNLDFSEGHTTQIFGIAIGASI